MVDQRSPAGGACRAVPVRPDRRRDSRARRRSTSRCRDLWRRPPPGPQPARGTSRGDTARPDQLPPVL